MWSLTRGLLIASVLALLASVLVLVDSEARAINTDEEEVETDADASGQTISAYVLHLSASSPPLTYRPTGGDGGSEVFCNYSLHAPSTEDPSGDPAEPLQPAAGDQVALYCWDSSTGQLAEAWWVTYDPANPFGPIGAAQRALEDARRQLVLPEPEIHLAPPRDTPQLVGVPSWFWVGDWSDRQTSAAVAGVVSTVTARPVSVRWDPGDGTGAFVCDGTGEPWRPGAGAERPPCGHTYTSSGPVTVTATITWETSWSATTGEGGALEPLTTTATWPVAVRQAQAVID